jgi:hypothetical protein
MAKHRVEFVQVIYFGFTSSTDDSHFFGHFFLVGFFVRNKLMQRRIEQTNGYRQILHGFENAFKIFALDW